MWRRGKMPLQVLHKHWNCRQTALPVVDNGRVHSPINSQDRTGSQFRIECRPFAQQCQSVTTLHKTLHLGRVINARVLVYVDSYFPKQFQEPRVGFRISLRVVQNPQMLLKVCGAQGRLLSKRIVGAETGHKPVPPEFLHAQFRMTCRQSYNRRVNLA